LPNLFSPIAYSMLAFYALFNIDFFAIFEWARICVAGQVEHLTNRGLREKAP